MKWTPDPGFWQRRGLPDFTPEFKFCDRKWKFDFAWDKSSYVDGNIHRVKIAIEIQGGLFIQGRHSGGVGQIEDMHKFNEAQRRGWKVFQFSPSELQNDVMNYPKTYKGKRETVSEFLRSVLT